MGGDLRQPGFQCEGDVSSGSTFGLQRYKGAFKGQAETAYRKMADAVDFIAGQLGIFSFGFIDATLSEFQSSLGSIPAQAPSPADFAVSGQDGKFTIAIANPANVQALSPAIAQAYINAGITSRAVILHNLQSCSTVDFDAAHNLTDYGNSPQLVHTYQNPNVTLFWRLRSSYDGKTWNKWQIYGDSTIACGPIGVYSGLLRTAALVPADASYTPIGGSPLTAATGVPANAATISVASFQVQYPFGILTYNSGSITPLLDSTKYYVYCLDPTYSGGAVTYFATVNNPDLSKFDSIIFLGTITTPAHGSGGTGGDPNSGGGGPCFTSNVRVITKTGVKWIYNIGAGDLVLTQSGWRKVSRRLDHEYRGPLHHMGDDEYVTPAHEFWCEFDWRAAKEIFPLEIQLFVGTVHNLEIDGDGSDDEQCFVLANGRIAHNQRKGA